MPPRWRTDVSKRKPRRRFDGIIHEAPGGERKRSLEVPLLWLGVAAFVGYPMLRDATSDKMQRNRYGSDQWSCECDYGAGRCNFEKGNWVGPWYAREVTDRKSDDPGRGACRERHAGGGYYHGGYAGAGASDDGYRSPRSVEAGYRGGFGGTRRVRAAGS